jgi:hypothetical protein
VREHAPLATHVQHAVVDAEHLEPRHVERDAGCRHQDPRCSLAHRAQPQLALHRVHGRLHQRHRLRRGHDIAAGHVEDADHLTGSGVMDGCGGARPRLHDPAVVLVGEYLHTVVERERGAGRIGAGVVLAPAGAGDEVHGLSAAAQ